jgi:hypothetical protein
MSKVLTTLAIVTLTLIALSGLVSAEHGTILPPPTSVNPQW